MVTIVELTSPSALTTSVCDSRIIPHAAIARREYEDVVSSMMITDDNNIMFSVANCK